MSGRVRYKFIEVDGEKFLCSLWYSDQDKLWCGESFETSNFPKTIKKGTEESLLQGLEEQIRLDLKVIPGARIEP